MMNNNEGKTFLTSIQITSEVGLEEKIFTNESARQKRIDIIKSNICELEPPLLKIIINLLTKVQNKVIDKIYPFRPKKVGNKTLFSSIIYETFNEETLSEPEKSTIQKYDSEEDKKLEEQKLINAKNLVSRMIKMKIQLKKKAEERKKNISLKIEKEMDNREYQNKLISMQEKNNKKIILLKKIEKIQSRTKDRIIKLEKLKQQKLQEVSQDSVDSKISKYPYNRKKNQKQKNNISLDIKSTNDQNIFNINTIPIQIHKTSEIQKRTKEIEAPQRLPKIYKSKFLLDAMRDRIINKQMQIYEKISKKQLFEKMKTYGILVNEITNSSLIPINYGFNIHKQDVPLTTKQVVNLNNQLYNNNEIRVKRSVKEEIKENINPLNYCIENERDLSLINCKGNTENKFYPKILEKQNLPNCNSNIKKITVKKTLI